MVGCTGSAATPGAKVAGSIHLPSMTLSLVRWLDRFGSPILRRVPCDGDSVDAIASL